MHRRIGYREVYSARSNRKHSATHGRQYHRCRPALRRHLPEFAWLRSGLVEKKFAIHRFHAHTPAILAHLDLRISVRPDLPDFQATGSTRVEVNPLAVAGPNRDRVAQRMSREAAGLSTSDVDHVNVKI